MLRDAKSPNNLAKLTSSDSEKKSKGVINTTNLYSVRKWGWFHRMFYRSMTPLMRGIVPKFFNFKCIGIENLLQIPSDEPLIMVANHRSHLDALGAFASIFPPRGNRRYMTTITPGFVLKENPLFKMMRYLGGYPIDRKNPQASLDYLYETLNVGLSVGIFPQGGRIARTPVEDYQKLAEEGKSGVGRLILRMKSKVNVLPAYIHGTAEALGRGGIKPKFGSYLSVTFGDPVKFTEYEDFDFDRNSLEFYNTARVVTDKIMQKIQQLCYETEKGLFNLIEKKLKRPIKDITLSTKQSKALQQWLRRFSHCTPQDFLAIS